MKVNDGLVWFGFEGSYEREIGFGDWNNKGVDGVRSISMKGGGGSASHRNFALPQSCSPLNLFYYQFVPYSEPKTYIIFLL